MTSVIEKPQLRDRPVPDKYVAFVDLLGFSERVLSKFDATLQVYESVLGGAGMVSSTLPDVKISIYSDSFILVSDKLPDIVWATQGILMQTLFHDCLARGGIAYGKHLEVVEGQNLFVVSEALVKAAMVEREVKHPCVALHHELQLSDEWWAARYARNLDRSVLYFGGLRLVNPCNMGWGQSAGTRVRQMLEATPRYRDKYEWFLELHDAIFSPVPMVPPRYLVPVDAA